MLQNLYIVTARCLCFLGIYFLKTTPFEEHNNFIHNYMFKWIVNFSIGIIELIRESFHFPKSVIVIVILVWLVCIVAKM